jgi:hypothetical protein
MLKGHLGKAALAVALASLSVSGYAAEQCNPTSTATCAIPFPSSYWMVDDAMSPTGKSISMTNNIIRQEIMDQLPQDEGFTPEGIFNGASGFSAASAAVFEFASTPDPMTLPEDGGSAVVAIDLTTGERVPVRAIISEYSQSDKVNGTANVIEVYPRSRWEYGHEIVVAITTDLGLESSEAGLITKVLSGTDAQRDYTQELVSTLTANGVNPLSVRNATRFMVRDRDEVTQPLLSAIDDVWQREHPVRNLDVTYNYYDPDIAARVEGEVLVYNYRTNNGTSNVDYDAEPMEQWIEFRLTIPAAARDGAVPVAMYAHGLGSNKESDGTVTEMNAEIGVATYSVGFPNHGARAEADGGFILSSVSTDKLGVPVGMINQNPIDFASAHRALQTSLASIDVVGKKSWRSWYGNKADGVADIDPSQVMMQGTSLGGVLGSTYGAVGNDLKGGVYHVTGVGVTSILGNSILWVPMFSGLVPSEANGAEAIMLRGAIQQSLDHGDSINYIDMFRNPRVNGTARPLMLTNGAGDTVVPNSSSVAAAHLADLPIVGEPLYDMPGVRVESDFDEGGYGIRHYRPVAGTVPLIWDGEWAEALSNASAHIIFTRKSDRPDQQDFINRFVFND